MSPKWTQEKVLVQRKLVRLSPREGVMTDKIVRMPASRGTILDPKTAQAYTELLVLTIGFLDKQIERAGKLPGADTRCQFLRAIEAHIATELDSLQLQGGQS